MTTNQRIPNRLIHEKSPYLLQHAHNPVDWFPWSDEAFQKAKSEDKPIFLSIGYSTCHWCHVMERESFEDEDVARLLNSYYVAIKVDREERPDVDNIYMSVCQAFTGHGGWPLTVIMTPDQKPFFAGTYFPKNDHKGMPGVITILKKIREVWVANKSDLISSGQQILDALHKSYEPSKYEIDDSIINAAFQQFKRRFDRNYGGFGSYPKFPSPHNLLFLLRYWYNTKEKAAIDMVEETLNCMYQGGIFDHIGYGFSRYSTDSQWLVPHFEKMLYDNALLAIAYIEAYQATGTKKFADVAQKIFAYVLRDMKALEGGFYSAEDADSEGEEGKFYVWTMEEIREVLENEYSVEFCKLYNVTSKGNFEGKNILNMISSSDDKYNDELVEKCREKLFEKREQRVHPYKDDKILTSWNGLMIAALSIAARILNKKEYAIAAENAAEFIFKNLMRNDGRLLARYRDGEASILAYVDDYAFFIWGLIELYELTFKSEYLIKAVKLNEDLVKYFWDNKNGGLYIYGSDGEQLIARPKEIYDGATPSGNSVAALNFQRLARMTGQHELLEKADQIIKAFSEDIIRQPISYSFSLIAAMYSKSSPKEVVVISDNIDHETETMINVLNEKYRPFTVSVILKGENEEIKRIAPYLEDYNSLEGKATAYVCENFSCMAPINDLEKFREVLS